MRLPALMPRPKSIFHLTDSNPLSGMGCKQAERKIILAGILVTLRRNTEARRLTTRIPRRTLRRVDFRPDVIDPDETVCAHHLLLHLYAGVPEGAFCREDRALIPA